MRRLVTVLLVLFVSVTLPMVATPAWATGESDASFARTYAGSAPTAFVATSVEQTADGGFIVAGITGSATAQTWLLRLDSLGGVVWQKMYGSTFVGFAGFLFSRPEAVELSDGGFVVDSTMNVSSTTLAARVFKVDMNGVLKWQERFAGTGNATATSIDTTADGRVVVAGSTGPGVVRPGLLTTALVLKLDGMGGLIWEKTYSGLGGSAATSIRRTSGGGFVVAGATTSILFGSQAWVLRLDSGGSVVWQKAYIGEGSFLIFARQTLDGGFIAAGSTGSPSGGPAGLALVLRLDSSGAPVWQKSYGGAGGMPLAFSTGQTSDGGFIVAGELISSAPSFAVSAFVFKLDSTGNTVWQKAFGTTSSIAVATSMHATTDGGLVVVGASLSTVVGSTTAALVFKLNSKGAIHPCKDLSETDLVASTLFTMATSITGSAVNIPSPATITTPFTSLDTGATSTLVCHHGFKP